MNFFEHQDQARRKTGLLVFYFILAILFTIVGVYSIIRIGMPVLAEPEYNDLRRPLADAFFDPFLFSKVAAVVIGFILLGSLYKYTMVSKGGDYVAELLGGRLVDQEARDHLERRLLNVVEEMAIASGTPMPRVYIMDHEEGINAFAAGMNQSETVIGVTRGTLERLNRDELQGVIAHEYSHIFNGDMTLNLRLIGILHGIYVIAIIGEIMMRTRSGSSREKNPLPLVGVGLFLVGWMGYFFGNLIKSSVSRQREYLADASAVQYTRNPNGIGGALKKIGGLVEFGNADLVNKRRTEVSHMMFFEMDGWLSTHPPLDKRIKAIDPNFDGNYPDEKLPPPIPEQKSKKRSIPKPGHISPENMFFAVHFLQHLTDDLRNEIFGWHQSQMTVFALLQMNDESGSFNKHFTEEELKEIKKIRDKIEEANFPSLLALTDLLIPSLKNMPEQNYLEFRNKLNHLIQLDGQVSFMEYGLQRIITFHLNRHFGLSKEYRPISSLSKMKPHISTVVSYLAYHGHHDPVAANQAFHRAMGEDLAKRPTLGQFDSALRKLSRASFKIKEQALNAAYACINSNGEVNTKEEEIVRIIFQLLDVPLPKS